MSDTHELTDKEIKKLEEAASTVKKFAKYIKQVNTTNHFLRKNLEESIKAGDVTNEQKCMLRCYKDAERYFEQTLSRIREKCKEKNCNCEQEKHDLCPLYQEFIVADWLHSACHGSIFGWDDIFEYACIGRKWQMGFPMDEALRNISMDKRLNPIISQRRV